MLGAGTVDVCPCISLTIHDKIHIIDYLLGRRTGKFLSLMSNGVLWDSYNNNKKQHTLWHKCGAYLATCVDIKLSITHGGQLLSSAQYDVYPDIYAPWLLSLYICTNGKNLVNGLEGPWELGCLHCIWYFFGNASKQLRYHNCVHFKVLDMRRMVPKSYAQASFLFSPSMVPANADHNWLYTCCNSWMLLEQTKSMRKCTTP